MLMLPSFLNQPTTRQGVYHTLSSESCISMTQHAILLMGKSMSTQHVFLDRTINDCNYIRHADLAL